MQTDNCCLKIYESVLDDWTPDENTCIRPDVLEEPELERLRRFKALIVITAEFGKTILNLDKLEYFLETYCNDWQALFLNKNVNRWDEFKAFTKLIDIDYDLPDGDVLIVGFDLPAHSMIRFCISLGAHTYNIIKDLFNVRIVLARNYSNDWDWDGKICFYGWNVMTDWPSYSHDYLIRNKQHKQVSDQIKKHLSSYIESIINTGTDSAVTDEKKVLDIDYDIECYFKKRAIR